MSTVKSGGADVTKIISERTRRRSPWQFSEAAELLDCRIRALIG
jgi:hypothetical protein